MDIKELANQAENVIDKIQYVTIATSSKNSKPWNSPVYSAFDKDHNFYWVSWLENQHSKNILENDDVFIVIYDSTVPEGTGFGVYLKGKATKLDKDDVEEIQKAVKLLAERKNGTPRDSGEYLGEFPRRIFKFVPEKIWVNSEGDVKGNFVDTRVEITNELLRK